MANAVAVAVVVVAVVVLGVVFVVVVVLVLVVVVVIGVLVIVSVPALSLVFVLFLLVVVAAAGAATVFIDCCRFPVILSPTVNRKPNLILRVVTPKPVCTSMILTRLHWALENHTLILFLKGTIMK